MWWAPAAASQVKDTQETRDHAESAQAGAKTPIERGFDLLYSLRFEEGRKQFTAWRSDHPDDPMSDIAIAASYLFEEFYLQRVLTSEFFLDDRRFLGGIEGKPDQSRMQRFNEAYQRGRDLASRQLEANPDDADALYVLTLATGIQAYNKALLEKQQTKSLSLMKESKKYANRLLELQPDAYDAWMAIGAVNYSLGVLPTLKRFFLWISGTSGDKNLGMEQLRITAEKGHYLKAYAKIFLALAALREKQEDVARKQLSDLAAEFPENHLFIEELARLNGQA